MKAVFEKINKCYEKSAIFNKMQDFCHSINIEDYKIVYRDFFANKNNIQFEKELAEENDFLAEKIYVDWLNKE